MNSLNQSKKLLTAQFLCIFLLLLVANIWTPYSADDFGYMYHCKDMSIMKSLGDYIDSIAYHTETTNGRYIAHFLGQLCLNIPKMAFNLINSAVFSLEILLCYRICSCKSKTDNLLLFSIFAAIWIFEPRFGEINLWVIGCNNYLWACVAALAFLLPFMKNYLNGLSSWHLPAKILFPIFAFFAGAYSEASSAAGIFAAILFCGLTSIRKKEKLPGFLIVSLPFSVLGYMSMIFSPAELNAKAGNLGVYEFTRNFVECTKVYYQFLPLIISAVVLFVVCIHQSGWNDVIFSAVVFFITSLFANYIYIFAAYYPGRGASVPLIFLVLSNGLFVSQIRLAKQNVIASMVSVLLIPTLFYEIVVGMDDIHNTNYVVKQVVNYIEESKADGIPEVKYPYVHSVTPYSIYYSGYQVNLETPDAWPNVYMAKYFGVEKIIGVESIKDIEEIPDFYVGGVQ